MVLNPFIPQGFQIVVCNPFILMGTTCNPLLQRDLSWRNGACRMRWQSREISLQNRAIRGSSQNAQGPRKRTLCAYFYCIDSGEIVGQVSYTVRRCLPVRRGSLSVMSSEVVGDLKSLAILVLDRGQRKAA